MNHIHRVVRNKSTGLLQVASETAKSTGGTTTASVGTTPGATAGGRAALLTLSMACAFGAAVAQELPTGGQIVSGSGTINQAGNVLTVNQASDKLITEWQSFGVGAGAKVQFVQPGASSVALARVLGSDVSLIQGQLSANGHLFLVNPNGILFTPTAQVNVGGLVASTLNISNDDFMSGNYNFSGASGASVVNAGQITATNGGTVALIAAKITNLGEIHAERGNVLMGAGAKVTLDLGGPVKLIVNEGAIDVLIEQGGAIRADGGLVYLTAKSASELAGTVISHTGITEAKTLASGERGQIFLLGDMVNDKIVVNGTLDASAPVGGDGGFIETSAAKVHVQDGVKVTTLATAGEHGEYLIDPTDFFIKAGNAVQNDNGIGNVTLVGLLEGGNVTIQTVAAGAENGDMYVNADVVWNANTTLQLESIGHTYVNALIHAQNSAGGKVVFAPGGAGDVFFGAGGLIGVSNADQLGSMVHVEHGKFRQYNNIDVAGGSYAARTFTGEYDGGGFSIQNYTGPWGLFQNLGSGASVSDLTLDNFTVTGGSNDDAGALASRSNGAVIYNVFVNNSSIAGERTAGGLVGRAVNTEFNNVTVADVTITKLSASTGVGFGGVAGESQGSDFDGADITALTFEIEAGVQNRGSFGGVVGKAALADITNANADVTLVHDEVTSGITVGGIVGAGMDVQISDVTANAQVTMGPSVSSVDAVGGIAGSVGGLSSMERASSVVDFDIEASFSVTNVGGIAGSFNGLAGSFANDVHATGDISATGGAFGVRAAGGVFGAMAHDVSNASFSGTLNASGGSVGNVGGAVGFAGADSVFIDITVNSDITVNAGGNAFNVGGLAGSFGGGTGGDISDADFTGQISLAGATVEDVGGAIGLASAGVDSARVTATGTMTIVGDANRVGGLIGSQTAGSIVDSTSTMNISGPTSDGASNVGGLVGSTSGAVNITDNTAGGSLTLGDDASAIGGLVGSTSAQTTIDGSSSSVDVAVGDGAENIGGLVGINNFSQILPSDASGSVTAGDRAVSVGGLVGAFSGSIDNVTSVSSVSVGADAQDVGGVFGKVTGATVDHVRAVVSVSAGDNAQRVGGLAGGVSDMGIITMATNVTVGGSINLGGNAQDVGGLVGLAPSGVFTDNNVDVNINAGTGLTDAGGMIGDNKFGTVITSSTASGDITALNGAQNIGGLIGLSDYFEATDLSAAGNITLGDGATNVGGFMGNATGNQTRVSATGDVTVGDGSSNVAGLTGFLVFGDVVDSDAAGNVIAGDGATDVGGLLSSTMGAVTNSHATGDVAVGANSINVGGLVGNKSGFYEIGNSSSAGDVSAGPGSTNVGGLVGETSAAIRNSVASGSVDAAGATNVGGIAGSAGFAPIENTRFEGAFVNGGRHVGGVAGNGGFLNGSFYNIDATSLNGSRQVTRGGLYAAQYAEFLANGALDITNYASSLPLDVDGFHVISDAQGLKDMLGFAGDFTKRFRLAGDIVAPAGWSIPTMGAMLDGAGHTISGVDLTALQNNNIGVFGVSFGSIDNLRISGNVSGLDQVGLVAGVNMGFMTGVYGFGTSIGEGSVGGLVGVNNGGIADSMANVDVTASMAGGKAGGLVGSQTFGGVYDVYAEGDVSGDTAGGLIGENTMFASVIKGYASGAVTGNTKGGAVAVDDLSGMTEGLFWDLGSTGQTTSAAGLGMSTADMMKIENFTSATAANGGVNPYFDFGGLWTYGQDTARPYFGLAAAPSPAPAPAPAPGPSPAPAPAPVQSTGDECVLIESLDVGCFRPQIAKPVESNTDWIQSSSIRASGFEGSAVLTGQVPEVTFGGNEIKPTNEDSAEKTEVSPAQQ